MNRRAFIALIGGAAVAWPLAARAQAQQPLKLYRIAVVHPSHPIAVLSETGGNPYWRAFFQELRRLGYIEGQNLVVERYSAEGRGERYAELVSEVVPRKPDLIFVLTPSLVKGFKEATATIPIVAMVNDPVAHGVVTSLARPGGNVTGVSVDAGVEIWGKRLEILREAVPGVSRVGFLTTPSPRQEDQELRVLREATGAAGIALLGPLVDYPAQPPEYRRAFAAMAQAHADALIVSDAPENLTNRQLVVELVEANRLPAIYPLPDYVQLGGLMAYAVDLLDIFRYAANQVDRVLRGEKPGEIPFYQPAKFEMVVNLKTAKALGIEMPPSILARADEVIE